MEVPVRCAKCGNLYDAYGDGSGVSAHRCSDSAPTYVSAAHELFPHPGPTLRDRFAMSVLTGLVCSGEWSEESWPHLARYAYDGADAMLAAREKKEPGRGD